jgi:phage terminase large subunit GpA-like protein
VQPTQGAAANFSKERFQTTVNCTPVLRDLIEQTSYRDSANTITHKEYPGGFLDFVGANSEIDVISRPKRVILCDEIDSYPPSAGTAGDPLKLAESARAPTHRSAAPNLFVLVALQTKERRGSRVNTRHRTSASFTFLARIARTSKLCVGKTSTGPATSRAAHYLTPQR